MKILLVAMNYAPEVSGTAPYTARIAKNWARDNTVEVLAGLPHYPEWEIRPGFRRWSCRAREDDVFVRRLRHDVPRRPSPIARLLLE